MLGPLSLLLQLHDAGLNELGPADDAEAFWWVNGGYDDLWHPIIITFQAFKHAQFAVTLLFLMC